MKREELIKKYKNKIAELQRTRDRYYSMGISDAACIIITGEIQAYNAVINDFSTLPDEKEEKPKIICICGSGRFLNEMHKAEEEMTLNGIIVLMIGVNTKDVARTKELAQYKPILDELHLRKIDLADGIFVININGYIGESTRNEINYAISQGKPVNYLEHNDIQLKNREDGK